MQSRSLLAVTCGALTAVSGTVDAAPVSYFLKFSGINNTTVVDKAYKGYSELQSFQWGLTITPSIHTGGGGGGGTQISFSDVSWNQDIDTATPLLASAATSGNELATARIAGFDDGLGYEYFSMDFTGVLLTSIQLTAQQGSPATLAGSFAYRNVTMTVTPNNGGQPSTPVTSTWSVNSPEAFSLSALMLEQLGDFGQPVVVPLPASLPMLLGGVVTIVAARRRHSAA